MDYKDALIMRNPEKQYGEMNLTRDYAPTLLATDYKSPPPIGSDILTLFKSIYYD